jgi:vacuolar-type H+-ATPase subunit I/STV1
MASARTLAWIERLVWIFLYVGLFAVVLGIASLKYHAAGAWSLIVGGGVLAVAGLVLVWVRSRLSQDS